MKLRVIKILTAPFRSNKSDLLVLRDLRVVLYNQRGQAFVEYVLLLVISVAIILGGLYQLSDAFRKFTAVYFGNYVTCLLEAGELPGAGILCTYKNFSLADGTPLVEPGSGGGGATSGGGGSGGSGTRGNTGSGSGSKGRNSSRPEMAQSEKTNPTARSSSESAGGGGSGGRGRSAAGDEFGKSMDRKKSKDSVELSAQDADAATKGGKGYRNANSGATGSTTSAFDQSVGRLRYVPMGSQDAKPNEKTEKIEINDADKKRTGKKIVLSNNDRNVASQTESDVSLTLPNFIRYLLIAAILVVIVFFLGGQALAFKKGQEKG